LLLEETHYKDALSLQRFGILPLMIMGENVNTVNTLWGFREYYNTNVGEKSYLEKFDEISYVKYPSGEIIKVLSFGLNENEREVLILEDGNEIDIYSVVEDLNDKITFQVLEKVLFSLL